MEIVFPSERRLNQMLEDNLNLSLERAEAVVEALVSEHEIERSRLLAKGVGPLAPVASNASEEGRAQNRRVALVAGSWAEDGGAADRGAGRPPYPPSRKPSGQSGSTS